MSLESTALSQQLIEEVWNHRRLDLVDSLIASHHTNHDPNTPDLGKGPEGYKRLVSLYTTAFPDLQLTIKDTICEDDKLVIVWQAAGTHKGDLRGTPPTNRKMFIEGVTVSHYANGKIVDSLVSWDALGMMQQLGIIPPLGQARAAGLR